MKMSNAFLKAGIVSEEQVKRSERFEFQKKKQEEREKEREKRRKSKKDFARKIAVGLAITDLVKSRPPQKILCSACGEEGYSIIETATVHSELMDEWSKSGKGLLFMIDDLERKKFEEELLRRTQERFGNIIVRGGCWKCTKTEPVFLKSNNLK